MSSDLTPAIFGVIGTAVGGIAASGLGVWWETTRFTRERDAVESDRSRAFRVEALQESQRALADFQSIALPLGVRTATGVDITADDAIRALSSMDRLNMWTARIHDTSIRELCDTARDALEGFGATASKLSAAELYRTNAGPLYAAAQDALSKALRAEYGSD